MDSPVAGFREIAHTADWQLEVWAPDIPGLIEQAARGMYTLAGVELKAGPRQQVRVVLRLTDIESLLVSFLGELLYLIESTGLAFDEFDFRIGNGTFTAYLTGAPLAKLDKEIKAVTYHNLEVRQLPGSLTVNIVFDV